MARSEISTEFNTFVGGILTEANPINFPPGYSLDEENFILERNGTRRRRFGTSLDTSSSDIDARAVTEFTGWTPTFDRYFVWRDASFGEERRDILVIAYRLLQQSSFGQDSIGLLFYSLSNTTDISGNFLDSRLISSSRLLTMSEYTSGLVIVGRNTESSASVGSNSEQDITAYALTRDDSGSDFTLYQPKLQIRDFVGTDGSNIGNRPVSLTENHAYNLYNAGWIRTDVDSWFVFDSTYPSISDSPVFSKNKGTAYDTAIMDNTLFGTSKAPTGRSVITPWYPKTEWTTAVNLISGVAPTGEPDFGPILSNSHQTVQSIDFNKGRLFYLCNSGRLLANGSTLLLFSQIGTDPEAFGRCYQINDPTSEAFNVPLDTDGGNIDVSSIGEGVLIKSSRARTALFGTKGVYELFSFEDIFQPTNLNIRQTSNNIIAYDKSLEDIVVNDTDHTTDKQFYKLTANSAISVKDNIYYWSDSGIIALVFDQQNNMFVEANLTEDTIDTLYREIPSNCKAYSTGVYSPQDNALVWAYSEDTANPERFTTFLCYDLFLKAWYKFKTPTSANITVDGLFVLSSESDLTDRSEKFGSLTFMVNSTTEGRVSSYPLDTTFQDFLTSVDVDEQQAFIQTGYLNANDSARQKQGTYIVPSFIRTEDGFTDDGGGNLTPTNESSCIISAYWDYAEDDSPKINSPFEAYRYTRLYIPEDASDTFNYGQSVITTKNRLTGRGRALSLRFETSEGKDCRLLGWNLGFGSNNMV